MVKVLNTAGSLEGLMKMALQMKQEIVDNGGNPDEVFAAMRQANFTYRLKNTIAIPISIQNTQPALATQ